MSEMLKHCRADRGVMSDPGSWMGGMMPMGVEVRHACGELDRETHLRMRADLTDHEPAAR